MRRVSIRSAREGQVLALPVVNQHGATVAPRGCSLTVSMIDRLKRHGVQRIFVEDPGFAGIECREGLDAATYSELQGFLERLVEGVQEEMDLRPFVRELHAWSIRMSDEVQNAPGSFLLYPNEGDTFHRWMAHTVNVALLAARALLLIGGKTQARYMVTAALLMDLGMWHLDETTHFEFYLTGEAPAEKFGRHVEVSLALAHTSPGLPSYVKAIVAQHHERCDGSGYPKALTSESIHPLARVMAVVDSYVAQTQRERSPLLPHDAMEWLMAGVGFEFDHTAVKAFRNAVHPYPVGVEVELDSGERGVVTGVRGALLSRPSVRVLWDAAGREVRPYYEIDLAQETTKSIKKVL